MKIWIHNNILCRKTFFLFALIFAFTSIAYAQELVKQKETLRFGKAKYYVLKSDMSTKHGIYLVKSYTGNTAILSGTYVMGEKDGDWMERYFNPALSLKYEGRYENGEKVGQWKYYDLNGDLSQIYDHNADSVIYTLECNKDYVYEVSKDGELVESMLDCPPLMIGGQAMFRYELQNEILAYPFEFEKNKKTTYNLNFAISFFVSQEGNIEDILIAPSIPVDLEKYIISKLHLRNGECLGASLNDEFVKAKMKIPIALRVSY